MSEDAQQPSEPTAEPAQQPEAIDPKVVEARRNYLVLSSWLDKLEGVLRGLSVGTEGALLLTRPSPSYFWQQTGFFIGPDEKERGKIKAFAKVGRDLYQPIGEIRNGNEFYPTQASKLLWAHDFAVAKLMGFVGAFKVQRKEDFVEGETEKADRAYLSEHERTVMVEEMKALAAELEKIKAIDDIGSSEYAEQKERLLDTIKLASTRCKLLDLRFEMMAKLNPEFKKDLSGIEPVSLAGAGIDFLRMKLNDDNMRRHYQQNDLVSTDTNAELALVESLLSKLEAQLPATEKDAWDDEALKQLLDGAPVLYPTLESVIAPFRDTSDLVTCGRACLAVLKLEKARLTAT